MQALSSFARAFTVKHFKAFHVVMLLLFVLPIAGHSQVLVQDDFNGAAGDPPDSTRFTWGGEVSQDGSSLLNFSTWTANTSWLQSITNVTPGAGETLVLKMRLSAYAEPAVYGDLQPRGLRVGNDANNAIEFYSIYGTTLGLRTRKDGVESMISYPFPQNVYAMHDYEIDVTTTSAVFKVDGVVAGTITSNLPTGSLNFYVDTYDGGAGNVPVSLDSVSLTQTNNQAQGPPEIYSFSPTSGPAGISVAVSGTNFTGVTAVQFDGVNALFTNNSESLINAIVPDAAVTGPVTVVSTNGTASSSDDFVVTPLDYTWTTNADAVTITIKDYTGTNGDVTIPSLITGLRVTAIGTKAFYSCDTLTNVTVPDGVLTIGDQAFSGCSALANITIGSGVTNIGASVFVGCDSMAAIQVDADNATYSSSDGVLFDKNQTLLIKCPEDKSGSYVMPSSVLTVGMEALYNCTALTNVAIGGNVTNIETGAFSWCTSLTNIVLPDSVLAIGPSSFYGDTALTHITLSTNLVSMGDYSFDDDGELKDITIPDGVTNMGTGVFAYCNSLTNATLGAGMSVIPDGMFGQCGSLGSIFIPDNITSIGDTAFAYSGLSSIAIGNSVTNIGNYAFEYCTSMTNILIPNSVSSIGYDAFKHCDSLANVTIPDSVINMGTEAFYFCGNLATATIGEGLGNIPSETFYGCDNLTNVVIGSNITNIDNYAFDGCESLAGIAIPDSVINIGDDAFAGCSLLADVQLGGNLVTIGSSAFVWCYSLPSITLPASVTSVGNLAFEQCWSLTNIMVDSANPVYAGVDGVLYDHSGTTLLLYPAGKNGSYSIPDGITSISSYAFDYCSGLTNVVIPNSVTNIGDDAFDNCSGLASLVIPDSVTSIGNSAFSYSGLANIIIGSGVTNVSSYAFYSCANLTGVYFRGNAPTLGSGVFGGDDSATVYYLPNTSDWSDTFGNRPTAVWPLPVITSFSPTSGPVGTEINLNGTNFTGASSVQLNGAELPFSMLSDTQITATVTADATSGTLSVTTTNGTWTSRTGFYVSSPTTDFTYTTNNGAITITGYIGAGGDVAIPALINNIQVTSITGNNGLQQWINVTNITISDTVVTLGDYAFYSCPNLKSITIPDSVTSIGNFAFQDCASLTDAVIPDSVTSIGNGAFQDCTSLTNAVIPGSVTNIGSFAFEDCTSLTSAMIGSGVTSIGFGMFEGCSRLASVTIPDSVKDIGTDAFSSCNSLTSITLPDSVTSIGYAAFFDCPGLISVTIPNSVTSIGDWAFFSCASLGSVMIPASVASIGGFTFARCGNMTNIEVDALNASYRSVDGVLFDKNQTTLIEYPGGKTNGYYSVPDTVIHIGGGAFYVCGRLTAVTFPKSVTDIGANAFCETGLTNLVISDGVTSIGDSAFQGCTRLIGVSIPDSVTNIGNYVFSGCSSLTNLVISDGVTSIGDSAFEGCTKLASITIGSGVVSIGSEAFADCNNLQGIYFKGDAPSVSVGVFMDDNVTVYYLANTAGWPSVPDLWAGQPTALWSLTPEVQPGSCGVVSNQFSFSINWPGGQSTVVVEACTNLAHPVWQPVSTNTLNNGTINFSDPQRTDGAARFYRLRSP